MSGLGRGATRVSVRRVGSLLFSLLDFLFVVGFLGWCWLVVCWLILLTGGFGFRWSCGLVVFYVFAFSMLLKLSVCGFNLMLCLCFHCFRIVCLFIFYFWFFLNACGSCQQLRWYGRTTILSMHWFYLTFVHFKFVFSSSLLYNFRFTKFRLYVLKVILLC